MTGLRPEPHCQGNIVNSYSVYDPVCLSTDAWYVQSFEVNGGIPGLPFCLHRDPIDPECKCSRQGISFITGTGCTNVTPLQKSYKVTPVSTNERLVHQLES